MEEKNELSDIILEEKEDSKVMKMKRILIIAALLILIFLITIVAFRMIKGEDPATQNAGQEAPKLVLPPEPGVQEATNEEDNLFKQVPIIEEEDKKESFEEMVKSLKEKEIKKTNQTPQTTQEEDPKPQVQAQPKETKTEPVTQTPPAPKPQAQKVETPKVEQKSATAAAGYYIQVGATSRLSPDKKYLDNITKQNFTHALLPISVNGKQVTKILIGPYTSMADAKQALPEVKNKINKDAFVYRVR